MFVALYSWRLKDKAEQTFRSGWQRVTTEIYKNCGSLGSRLHRAEDGTIVAYAQWKNRDDWQAMQSFEPTDREALSMMRDSIAERFPVTFMEVADHLLQPQSFSPNE